MSLREELERRRLAKNTKPDRDDVASSDAVAAQANETAPVALPATAPSYLRLTKTNNQSWLLPWACFHGASHEPGISSTNGDGNCECERLHMIFLRHEVMLQGRNLSDVLDALESASLRQLNEVSKMYQPAACGPKVLVITKIEITPR